MILIILDGFGYREEQKYNAIANANKPHWDYLWKNYPHIFIEGSGHAVGLPDNQMGNSEVGHLNMGAGRVVYQDLTRIDQDIKNNNFNQNPVFNKAFDNIKQNNTALHVMGLLSPGGVHSHEDQIKALLLLAKSKNINHIYFHAFLDGRDTPPKSALDSLEKIQRITPIASIMGRYYAMDRDNRTERTQAAFDVLTQPDFPVNGEKNIIETAYSRGETDEFIKPTRLLPVYIKPEDSIIFMNFRSDRARQLTKIFLDHNYKNFISLTQYSDTLNTQVAYPPSIVNNTLSHYLSELQLRQLHIAETEKYAHVTFFFNGGIEKPFPGEDRLLINSPNVSTYDLKPEMSAYELTDKLTQAILSKQYNFIVCNFANADMVGHTGNYPATIKAIETLDDCLGKIYDAIQKTGDQMLITADHGNAECMYDDTTQQPHTAHTSDPVPLVYVGQSAIFKEKTGVLADIAPSILYLMGLKQPSEMTGKNLFGQCEPTP